MKRAALPMILVLLGVWGLLGCVYLPLPHYVPRGQKDFRKKVGGPNSSKPVRPHATDRAGVVAALGEPGWRSPDDREYRYTLHVVTGIGAGLCFVPSAPWAGRTFE